MSSSRLRGRQTNVTAKRLCCMRGRYCGEGLMQHLRHPGRFEESREASRNQWVTRQAGFETLSRIVLRDIC